MKKTKNKKIICITLAVISIILAIAAVFCIQKEESSVSSPTLESYMKILETNSDYKEYKDSFYKSFGRYPEFIMTENVHLDKTYIFQKIEELKGSPYLGVYQDLPDSDSLYLVRLKEMNETNRGLISVIDIKKKEVARIFALLDINLG